MARGKSKKRNDPERALIDAAMVLASQQRWQDIRMAAIAEEAKMSLPETLRIFPGKSAILTGLGRAIDDMVLTDLESDPDIGETAKDRLFDLLMRRFDALEPYKAGLAGVALAFSRNPCAMLSRLPGVHASMALTLEAAGISAAGPCGQLRTHGLTAIYANGLRIWFRDDTPDMARTMAAIDKGLSAADRFMSQWSRPERTAAETSPVS